MTEEMIKRINELARKKKETGLTPEELTEQKELYAVYLKNIREQVKAQLETNLTHDCGCDCCGDHHHHHNGKCQH